jgi:cytochrome c1
LVCLALLAVLAGVAAFGQEARSPEERGAQLFRVEGCYGCHTIGVVGTPIAPDLSRLGVKHTRSDLEQWLRDPAMQRPTAHMPRLELSEFEVKALAAFLSSLH